MTETEKPDNNFPSKEEIVANIARTLSEKRAARHVSLQAVSQRLKIRVPLLEALENGRWDELPGDIYIRGFVIRYAQYLGIDGQSLIEPYLQYNAHQEPKIKSSGGDSVWSEGTKSSWLWITVVIIVFVVLIKFLKPSDHKPLPDGLEPVRILEPVISTATATPVPKPLLEEHHLEIFTPYQLWLKVTTPKKVFEGFIPDGSTWNFKSEGEFQVRFGHTREVQLRFDGRQVPLFDRQKSIRLPNES